MGGRRLEVNNGQTISVCPEAREAIRQATDPKLTPEQRDGFLTKLKVEECGNCGEISSCNIPGQL